MYLYFFDDRVIIPIYVALGGFCQLANVYDRWLVWDSLYLYSVVYRGLSFYYLSLHATK